MASKKARLSETERFEPWHEEKCLWNIWSDNYNTRQEKEKSVGRMSEKLEMTNNHFFKMFIWILVLWMRGTVVSEAYSELSRTSKMELFARIANCFSTVNHFLKIFILDVWQVSDYASGSLTISKPLIFLLKTVFR